MSPTLEEMSLEELWQLFPDFLREHQAEWRAWYEGGATSALEFLPEHPDRSSYSYWLNIGKDHLGPPIVDTFTGNSLKSEIWQ